MLKSTARVASSSPGAPRHPCRLPMFVLVLGLLIPCGHCLLHAPPFYPRSFPLPSSSARSAGVAALASLPDGMRALGMDDALWERTRNQKNLLKLLKKGDHDQLRKRIERTRELVAEEQAQQQARVNAFDADELRRAAMATSPFAVRRGPLKSAAGLFPKGAEEAELKRRFKQLAKRVHPDLAGTDPVKAKELQEEFQVLQAEYFRLLSECKSASQRETLQKGWVAMGGLAVAMTLASPLAAGAAAASAAVAAAYKQAADRRVRDENAGSGSDRRAGSRPSLEDLSVPQLYRLLDKCMDAENYTAGAKVKKRIDELTRT